MNTRKKSQRGKRRKPQERKRQIKSRENLAPDMVLKEYWRNKREFADLFNAYVYGGRAVIDPERLHEIDTDITGYAGKKGKRTQTKGARDVVKVAMDFNGVRYVILGIENQSHVHYAMPLKVMAYDLFSYNRQVKEKKRQYISSKEKLQEDEYLSGLKKDDRLIPVITLVLYTGRRGWDGPVRLSDMLEIPEELKEYVSDYKINIIEMRSAGLNFNNKNNQDLFNIIGIVYNDNKKLGEKRNEIEKYEKEHHIDNEVKTAVNSITGKDMTEEEEKAEMMTIWDEIREDGKLEGLERGLEQGKIIAVIKISRKYSATEEQCIENIMEELDVTREKAEEYYKEYSTNIE